MSTWVVALLNDQHNLADFSSGQPILDDWLRRSALRAQTQDITRTYVWTAPNDDKVVAFYSLQPHHVVAESVSRGIAGGHANVTGYLLAKLALDSTLHGQGLGGQLLRDALEIILAGSRLSGGRVVVVDPIDEAVDAFYRHFGFTSANASSSRLIMKVATLRAHLTCP